MNVKLESCIQKFDEVKDTFISLKIYTFLNGKIVQLDRDTGEFIKITQEKIYP